MPNKIKGRIRPRIRILVSEHQRSERRMSGKPIKKFLCSSVRISGKTRINEQLDDLAVVEGQFFSADHPDRSWVGYILAHRDGPAGDRQPAGRRRVMTQHRGKFHKRFKAINPGSPIEYEVHTLSGLCGKVIPGLKG
ncbi:MAG: hypothetical protein WBJ62_00610 [Coriobacteriia bacterium]